MDVLNKGTPTKDIRDAWYYYHTGDMDLLNMVTPTTGTRDAWYIAYVIWISWTKVRQLKVHVALDISITQATPISWTRLYMYRL
jgi:hypothetical protein